MGQQQLLLLVMGIVIVGFAVMAGLQTIVEKMKQSTADTLVERNLSIATEAVFWKSKRDPYSGGNASYSGLEVDGMKKLFLGETTHNGFYKITTANGEELVITAVGIDYPEIGVQTYVNGYSIDSTVVSFEGNIIIP